MMVCVSAVAGRPVSARADVATSAATSSVYRNLIFIPGLGFLPESP